MQGGDVVSIQSVRSPFRSLSDKWFELALVTTVLAATLVAHHLLNTATILLHFFYLPVGIAAYYFGRRLAAFTALLAVSIVTLFAILDPGRYQTTIQTHAMLAFTLLAWGAFLGMNALLVGTLCDQRSKQVEELRQAHLGIIEILSKYLQAADQYTKSHSQRVADLSEQIAVEMGLKQAQIEDIRVGALLHDIGKVEISTRLIQKAAGLTATEKSEVEAHTVRGAELVRSLGTILEGAIPVIMHHHDYWSAEAKAEGAHGNDIPLEARIVSVADAYDAIITDRPYRRGRTPQEAVIIIRAAAGKQFDPKVVSAFERVIANRSEDLETHSERREALGLVDVGV